MQTLPGYHSTFLSPETSSSNVQILEIYHSCVRKAWEGGKSYSEEAILVELVPASHHAVQWRSAMQSQHIFPQTCGCKLPGSVRACRIWTRACGKCQFCESFAATLSWPGKSALTHHLRKDVWLVHGCILVNLSGTVRDPFKKM